MLRRYILVRLLLTIPALIIITSIIFLLLHMAPGNPIDVLLAASRGSREVREVLIRQFGFDKPWHVQYSLWLYNTFTGNLGVSLSGIPVTSLIASRIWFTLELMLISQFISIFIAVAFGALAGYRRGSALDKALTFSALFGYSIPDFWLGLILILVFSVMLGWFPVGAFSLGLSETVGITSIMEHLGYLVLPVAVLVISYTPYYFRLLRASMVEILDQDYITTAKAKGASEAITIYKHALKNALIPLTTAVGTSFGLIFGGNYIVEVVFAWPGLGTLLVAAALRRDYWIVMGVSFVTAVIVIVSSVVLDVVYAYINPKIRFGGAEY